jgi:tRNA-Thr(GGU) m(6)t(6)A37 methyltransferase TsaA
LPAPAAALETGLMKIEVVPVGWVESPLTEMTQAPMQPHEGAPPAWLVFEAEVADALRYLRPGTEILVLTWLDRADRSVLLTIPRGDPGNPLTGVFLTRSPDRPNPIGLHRVRVTTVDGLRVQVDHLEALDGTPVIDVKAVLDPVADR